MIDYFSSLELSPSAVADWDVCNVEWRLTTWNLDRPRDRAARPRS